MSPRRFFDSHRLKASLAILALTAGLFGLSRHLRLNSTDSAPRGLYLIWPGEPHPGSWVAVCLSPELGRFSRRRGYLPRGTCPAGAAPVLKRLAAAPGDRIDLGPTGLWVNGRRQVASSPQSLDSRGRALPVPRYGSYRVGEAELWLMSPHPKSWDSRYFGPLERDRLLGIAKPVWIWGNR